MRILLATEDQALAELVRKALARFHYNWEETASGFDAFQMAITRKYDLAILDYSLSRMTGVEILRRFRNLENFKAPPAIMLTDSEPQRQEIENEHFSETDIISRPLSIRKLVSSIQNILHQTVRVACLGGGTGLFSLLSGLKTLPGLSLSSIVAMSDDGGSTGKLRAIFGVLPPGDVRRSLVALSNAPDLLNELMQYRFQRGDGLEGHNLGNLLLTALSHIKGNMTNAVRALGEILNIQGQVIPVTETASTLKAELADGVLIEGENKIDIFESRISQARISKLWLVPEATASLDALVALLNAKYIILGPGDLYTSIITNLIVTGIPEAIQTSKAKKIYICNVMTKPGETTDYTVEDHVREVLRYLKKDCLDYIICSSTRFSESSLGVYAAKGQKPVKIADENSLRALTQAMMCEEDVASEHVLVRHDGMKIAQAVKKIIEADGSKAQNYFDE